LSGRPACLIEFLSGISVDRADSRHNRSPPGAALGELHMSRRAASRANGATRSTLAGWHDLAAKCGDHLDDIAARPCRAGGREELAFLDAHWPTPIWSAASSMRTCSPTMC
jgi:homoserine kinase type II